MFVSNPPSSLFQVCLFLLAIRILLKFNVFRSFSDSQLLELKIIIDNVEVSVLPMRFNACVF